MKYTTPTKTMSKTFTNIVAVVTALSLVFLQMPILDNVQQARADATAEATAQMVEEGSVDVGFDFDHAYIEYDGQVIAPPASMVTLPLGQDLVFFAQADSGYVVDSVEANLGGTTTKLEPDADGYYTVSADALLDGGASVAVKAVSEPEEVEAAEDVEEAIEEDLAAEEAAAEEEQP